MTPIPNCSGRRRWWVTIGLVVLVSKALSAQERRAPLTRDTVIDGISCAPTGRASAEWHANGRLLECPLRNDTTMWSHRFPAGSWIRLHDDGAPDGAWLSRDTPLSGYACRGDGYKRWAVRFHPNGVLSLCFLRHDTVIRGVPCLRGTFYNEVRGGGRTGLLIDSTGLLRRCQAARDFTRSGRRYRKWDLVDLPVTPSAEAIH
jgi:hypothetical protein